MNALNRTATFTVFGLLTLTALSASATGRMTCDSGPQEYWQTKQALETHLVSVGWEVRRSKVDGGCYEVYGTTPEGDRVEAYFDPKTFEKLLVARRGEVLFKKGE